MNIGNIFASNAPQAHGFMASRFQTSGNVQSFSNVRTNIRQSAASNSFQQNSPISGNAAAHVSQAFTSPSSVSGATAARNAPVEPFNINNYFNNIPEDEVWNMVSQLGHTIRRTDMSGMTAVEAYDFIEQLFIEAFGEHFLLADQLQMSQSMTKYAIIGSSFYYLLSEHFINNGVNGEAFTRYDSPALFNINRERLFGDATDDEIFETIRARFPETLSHRDFLVMYHEMRGVGLLNNETPDGWPAPGRNELGMIGLMRSISGLAFSHPDIPWEINLHKPINIPYVLGKYNMWQWQGEFDRTPMLTEFLVREFGGEFDSRGWFIGGVMPWDWFGGRFGGPPEDYEFANLRDHIDNMTVNSTPDLLSMFLNTLDEHDLSRHTHRREHNSEALRAFGNANLSFSSLFSREFLTEWQNAASQM
jgi:hypothetical protein